MVGLSHRVSTGSGTLRSAWRRLRPLCGDRLGSVAALVGASVAAGLVEAGVLALVADVAAAMVTGGHRLTVSLGPLGRDTTVGTALLIALVLAGLRLVLRIVVAWLPARISSEVQARLRRELFDAYIGASWSAQSQQHEGHLQELMTDQVNQATQVVVQVISALSGGAMLLALVGTAFALNALVALIILALAVLLFGVLRPIALLGGRAARELSQTNMDHAEGISESVRLAEEAHVFGVSDAVRRRGSALIDAAQQAFFRYQLMGGLSVGVYQSLAIILIVAGLGGLYVTGAGHLAQLGAVVLMLVRATSYAQQLQGGYQALSQVRPYLDRLQGTIAGFGSQAKASGSLPLPAIESLALVEVSYAYPGRPRALREVSFEVQAGEAIGIVGPSGAGKSTLVQILLRLREPASGGYLINGHPVDCFSREDWERRVAYVPQEPRLIRGTVAENIRFFRLLDESAVERAALLAHIHHDVLALPHGYETVIGQVADAMSGGQRQRICLARALAGEPELLVLDEPTSSVDVASEAAMLSSLMALKNSLTLLIVAHRASTIAGCDRVLLLVDGSVRPFAIAPEADGDASPQTFESPLLGQGR